MKRNGANPKEADRWLRQAEVDLQAARDSAAAGHHEWACFQAQQCGEKALKAVLHHLGYRAASSHWLLDLLEPIVKHRPEFASLEGAARELDGVYIPTRYPSGVSESRIPATFYTGQHSGACLSHAESILIASKSTLGGSRPSSKT